MVCIGKPPLQSRDQGPHPKHSQNPNALSNPKKKPQKIKPISGVKGGCHPLKGGDATPERIVGLEGLHRTNGHKLCSQ